MYATGNPKTKKALREAVVMEIIAEKREDGTLKVKCTYFALCDHEAVGVTEVGILGYVPVCQRCADKLGITPIRAEFTLDN